MIEAWSLRTFFTVALTLFSGGPAVGGVVQVTTTSELRQAIRTATPGTRIEVAPGEYLGGLYFENLRGEKERPIVIAAADQKNLPRISGSGAGIQLVNPFFVELHDLHFTGASGNGISIDDGGRYSPAPRGLLLRGLRVTDAGPRGNHDGIKLSGLRGFRIENCVIERWGAGSGSGIDMVGCQQGVISGNTFRHEQELEKTGGSGVQVKGGCAEILIRGNRFEHAGQRGVNIGGSTGLQYFRPPLESLAPGEPRAEARSITVEGNTFIGSMAPVTFAGVDGATVRFNTIYHPGRWAMRILQETTEPGFVPCRNGVFSDNLIVFESSRWAEGGVNIGPGVAAETFRFARNAWYCRDRPEKSKPTLPASEEEGVYGADPQFQDEANLKLMMHRSSPVRSKGAEALPPAP
jgi:hypothetical protein